jgi:hypothetical protein
MSLQARVQGEKRIAEALHYPCGQIARLPEAPHYPVETG